MIANIKIFIVFYWRNYFDSWYIYFSRSLPKISSHEEEGNQQNPQYTGQHHFHPVPHDHDFCERIVINVIIFDPPFDLITLPNQAERIYLGIPLLHCYPPFPLSIIFSLQATSTYTVQFTRKQLSGFFPWIHKKPIQHAFGKMDIRDAGNWILINCVNG